MALREIIFRGKRLDNGEWVEGWFEMYPFGRWPLKAAIIPSEEANDGYFYHEEVDPSTVGQFTGLVDKAGKRIFEGDVVRYGNRTGYVIFGTGCFCVQDSTTQNHPAIDLVMFQWDVTVVGNIHDNPELMEVTPDE